MTTPHEAERAGRASADPLASRRAALFLATAVVIGACIVLAVVAGSGWSWPLFIWGAILGPLAMIANRFILRVSARYLDAPPDKVEEVNRRNRERSRTTYPIVFGMSIAFGIAAAGLESVWVDVLFTVITLVSVGLPLLMLPLLKRRFAPGG